MSFLALFVIYGIFESVEVNFLDVGHTHNDIDRHFSYFGKTFKREGNETLEKMRENIAAAFTDYLDSLTPETEINDENWGICVWMQPHMYGLKGLAQYHGFLIQKFPELETLEIAVGLKFKQWVSHEWSTDCKPLFKSLPQGKPPMEMPKYKSIDTKQIRKTLDHLVKLDCLTADHMVQWERTFETLTDKTAEWKDRYKKGHLPELAIIKNKGTTEEEVVAQYVKCTWKEWPLDHLKAISDKPVEIVEEDLSVDVYNPEHSILNKFIKHSYSTDPEHSTKPVLNNTEDQVTKFQDVIVREHHVIPGHYAILLGELDNCVENRWRPCNRPWVAKILSKLDKDGLFSYCWMDFKTREDSQVLKWDFRTREPVISKAPRAYFEAMLITFCKSTGFTSTGSLKKPIMDKYVSEPQVREATKEYDRAIQELT